MKRFAVISAFWVVVGWTGAAVAEAGTDEEIRERIKPFGSLCVVGQDCGGPVEVVAAAAMGGQEVYQKFCSICHQAGVAGAPLLQDAAQWEPRLAKGMDVLFSSTINGINAMPPMGTCMACSDDELKAAIDYMIGAE